MKVRSHAQKLHFDNIYLTYESSDTRTKTFATPQESAIFYVVELWLLIRMSLGYDLWCDKKSTQIKVIWLRETWLC